MSVLQRKLWRELVQLRGQMVAIAMVMVGGIAMMTMALSNYQALSATRALYYAEYRFADVFAQAKRVPLPMLQDVRAVPGVRQAQARVAAMVAIELEGYDEPVNAHLVSQAGPGDPGLNGIHLRQGRLAVGNDEVVVADSFADAHALVPGDTLVAILNGRRQVLRVSGIGMSPEFVYQIRPGDLFPDFERFGVMWMAREPLAMAFDLDGAFNDVVLTLERDAREADVIDALDALLLPYGGIGAHGRDLQISHRFLDEELGQLLVMTRMFTLIFLGVAAFLLNIVVGRLVGTQREQIAVLKAFGYTRWQVGAHYAQLVLLMVGAGVVPGLALGAWGGRALADVYTVFYSFPYLAWTLSPSLVALAVAFAVAAAAAGTLGALARAFRLPPAQAMQPEAPPVFHHTWGERMGLARWLDPTARIVLRNLERRPLRTLMSVLGIGLACGILVMSRFQAGAIEEMVEVQFGFAQRDDFTVAFAEPTSWRAVDELAALPGVEVVEPFRASGVILRVGHREYRTSLLGLPDDGDLKRVLDRQLHPARLPGDGLLLTDHLAGMLDVEVGGLVEVEFREGRRERIDVPLAGTVREYMGVGAYMRRERMNAILGEGDVVSGAWLGIDRDLRLQVLDSLRERPRVVAITDSMATVTGFRETMARGMLTFTLVATLLAGSIAVGVVYNAARITLAERSHELASLRVLGYTRGEVRRLLGGELFTLAFLALLPGFALGLGMTALLVRGFESDLYRIPLVIAPSGYAWAGLLVLAATAVSVALVRRRLDRIDLASALKTKE